MSKPEFIYEVYIRAPIESVWTALTTPEFTSQYFHATHIESDWQLGSEVLYRYEPGGRVAVSGEVLACDVPNLLEISWLIHYDQESNKEGHSRVRFELDQLTDQVRLRVVHDGFPEGSVVLPNVSQGWPWILSSLKSLLETDQPLAATGS